jgi:enterochelin esterase-like enzyme
MRVRRLLVLALLLGAGGGAALAQDARADATEHLEVFLPAGYATSGRRYPVIYGLQGLPKGSTGYLSIDVTGWGEAAERVGHPAIVVSPQGSTDSDRDPEWLDWGQGREWSSVVAIGVVRRVDRWYRTVRNRTGRAIIGDSAGGYGAAIIGLQHPQTFSLIQSWSGYFHPTNPNGTAPLELSSAHKDGAADVHDYVSQLDATWQRYPTRFGFYVGNADHRFLGDNEQLDREMVADGVPHHFAVYSGGHDNALWSAHVRAWIGRAARALASG